MTFYVNCLHGRQFAWNVKTCFQGKNKKKKYFKMSSADFFYTECSALKLVCTFCLLFGSINPILPNLFILWCVYIPLFCWRVQGCAKGFRVGGMEKGQYSASFCNNKDLCFTLCVSVLLGIFGCVCVRARACVCVCVRERDAVRGNIACVRVCVCVHVRERERERESLVYTYLFPNNECSHVGSIV